RRGAHGGDSRLKAPGRAYHANTSARGASTTLEYCSPIVQELPNYDAGMPWAVVGNRDGMGIKNGIRSVLDTALDRTIVSGYTRVGYHLRQFGWADDPEPGALQGQTALVTGANRGIGKAIVAGLA